MPKSQKTEKHLPPVLHDNQTFILCLSWDTEMQRHPKITTNLSPNYFLTEPNLHKLLFELPDMLQRCLWGEVVPRNHNEDPKRQPASERNLGSQSV